MEIPALYATMSKGACLCGGCFEQNEATLSLHEALSSVWKAPSILTKMRTDLFLSPFLDYLIEKRA
jgi:hypothetical protein